MGICDVLIDGFLLPLSRRVASIHVLVADLFTKLPGPLPDLVVGASLAALCTHGALPHAREDKAWTTLIALYKYIVSHTILDVEPRQNILRKIEEWTTISEGAAAGHEDAP
jgi:hypothetical protein